MMSNKESDGLEKALMADAVCDCFEQMAFMEVIRGVETGMDPSVCSLLVAKVSVLTPFSASLRICCSMAMAQEITATLFGPACEEVTHPMIIDVMGEMANTIVGRLMGQLVGANEQFTLDIPQCQEFLDCTCTSEAGCSFFLTGDHHFSVCFKRS